ncbi:PAS domain S-box protein [delta proteobacterium NaphS2]|nr:PAS domain S-box protein [delta proteobacterium NaphS2]
MEQLTKELQAYQRRLEAQNEALRKSKLALAEAREALKDRIRERTRELEATNRQLKEIVREKIQMADSLSISETRYRSLVESTDDFIYLLNEEGAYLFMNNRTRSYYNLLPKEVPGRYYSEFHAKKQTAVFMERLKQVFERGTSIRQEHQQNGRYFLRTLSPVKNKDGTVRSVTVVSKEITEETRLHADLSKINEQLWEEQSRRIMLSRRLINLLEEDRRRIAGDLHDQVGQRLTSLKLNLEQVHSEIRDQNGPLCAKIDEAIGKTSHVLNDIKNISRELRPAILDSFGLVRSLSRLLKELEQKGIRTHFFQKGVPERFDPEKELALYRIAQEAIQNIMKHANASEIHVNLVKEKDNICLSVEDNGIGFTPRIVNQVAEKGPLGLLIMRERAFQLKGELTLESAAGRGTHLSVEIPLQNI